MNNHLDLDKVLRANGWRFDPTHERFTDGDQPVEYHKVLSLVPGMTLHMLIDYVNSRAEATRKQGVLQEIAAEIKRNNPETQPRDLAEHRMGGGGRQMNAGLIGGIGDSILSISGGVVGTYYVH